jgi:hypothetical protein
MLTSGAIVRAALLVPLVLLVGCNDGPKVVKVSGTVTHNGKPVPSLTIHFIPETGRPSWALTDENGRFNLEYDNKIRGALVGKHTVWVQWRARTPQEEMNPKLANRPAVLPTIEAKYGSQEKSPLKIEITESVDDLEIKLD